MTHRHDSFAADDGATRERLIDYARQLGATIGERSGEVVAATFPDFESIVDWCTFAALDGAEYCPPLVRLALDLGTPERVHAWMQAHIEWRDEPGERLSAPSSTLKRGWGDCDDHAVLETSMISALGFPAAVVALTLDGEPTHAATLAELARDDWWWFDSTEPGSKRPYMAGAKTHPLARDARPGRRGVILPRVVRVPAPLTW